jgi:cytosine deaminase
MAFDLILRNARIANGGAIKSGMDIAIADGRIAAIEPRLAGEGMSIDTGDRFVSPGLVESHFHLDKARILDRCAPPSDRRATDHMKRTSAAKHTFTEEDVYARASATLEECQLNGVTHMRTHVEVDPNVELRGYMAIERLARDYAWGVDLELCVFLQEGWTNVEGAEANVVAALERGAPVVGGAPRYDTNGPAQIDRIFALAKDFNVEVDIHLDMGHTTDDMDIFQVMDLTDKMGWGGRVAIGHGSKYSCLPPDELAALGRRLANSGVALSVLPATDMFNVGRHMEHSVIRGVADANALLAEGANCSIATNNIMNPFTPFGDCSLVRIANFYANVVQRGTEAELTDCFSMLTERAARIMRRKDYGIAVGNPADLVVWNARTPAETIATVAPPVMGFKRGRRTFKREIAALNRP